MPVEELFEGRLPGPYTHPPPVSMTPCVPSLYNCILHLINPHYVLASVSCFRSTREHERPRLDSILERYQSLS